MASAAPTASSPSGDDADMSPHEVLPSAEGAGQDFSVVGTRSGRGRDLPLSPTTSDRRTARLGSIGPGIIRSAGNPQVVVAWRHRPPAGSLCSAQRKGGRLNTAPRGSWSCRDYQVVIGHAEAGTAATTMLASTVAAATALLMVRDRRAERADLGEEGVRDKSSPPFRPREGPDREPPQSPVVDAFPWLYASDEPENQEGTNRHKGLVGGL